MSEMMSSEGSDNEFFGLEGVSGDSGPPVAAGDLAHWIEDLHRTDIFKGLDAFALGDDDGFGEVDSVGGEESIPVASAFDQELALAALSNIPKPGAAQRRKKEDRLKSLTAEDFEPGPERLSFEIIKANVDALFDSKRKASDYVTAAMWVFGRTTDDVNFETCCQTLCTRKDVLRLRIHYEFWRKWFVLPVPFPFLIDPIPDAVEGEIYIVAGDEGHSLASIAWRQPGIGSAELIAQAARGDDADKYRRALELLSEKYLLSQNGDSWYLTGRNPTLKAIDLSASPYKPRLNHYSWSRLF